MRSLKRGVSMVLAASLVVCAPVDVSSVLGQKLRGLIKEASAHNEDTIDASKLMDSNIIPDANLLNYLYEEYKAAVPDYSGSVGDVTVQKFNQAVKGELTIPSTVSNIQGLGYARYVTKIDLSQCKDTDIDAYEFNACSNLTSVTLSSNIKTIGDNAFQDCIKLSSIDLSNVDNIGSSAFVGCLALTDASIATMKATLKDLGTAAFKGCTAITTAFVPVIQSSARAHTVPAELFSNCSALTKVTFFDPEINMIAASAFVQTSYLTFNEGNASTKAIPTEYGDKLPTTITAIEESAFMGSRILSLDISENNITEIKKQTFRGTVTSVFALHEGIKLPNTLKKIDDSAFMYTYLTEIVIPDSVTTLEDRCFYGCSFLTDITLSANITEIPFCAFAVFDTLNIRIENGSLEDYIRDDTIVRVNGGMDKSKLEKIDDYAFFAGGVSSIEFPANLTNLKEIGSYAFAYSRFTKLEIPASVETMGEGAVFASHTLKSVAFKEGSALTEIPDKCFGSNQAVNGTYGSEPYRFFYSCYKLESVQLPENLVSIGEYAFGYNYVLNTMGYKGKMEDGKAQLPDTLTTLSKGSFKNNMGLDKVYISDKVEEIPEEAFYACADLDIENKDAKYDYTKAVGLDAIHLPSGLKKIGNSAFYNCCALEGFIDNNGNIDGQFPEELEEIGDSAFYSCKNFTKATFNSALKSIGKSAFSDCSRYSDVEDGLYHLKSQQTYGLSEVDFSFASSLTTIGTSAFAKTNITAIAFPSLVTVIPSSVCEGCYNLKTVSMYNDVTKVDQNAFKDAFMLKNVTIPITAEWANTLFGGYAGMNTYDITINTTYDKASYDTSKKSEKINVNHDQDNILEINCFKNFSDSCKTMSILDKAKDNADDSNDLLKYDNNDYIKTTLSGNNQISVHGKKLGETDIRLSANIDLYPNESEKYNECGVVLSFVHDYTVSVVQNPVKDIVLESTNLVTDNGKNTLYLEKGSSANVLLSGQIYPVDTTDNVEWNLVDDTIATLSDVSCTSFTTMTDSEKNKGYGVTKGYLKAGEYGSTTLNLSASDKVYPVTVDVRRAANSLSITENSSVMDVGKTKTLKVTLDYGSAFKSEKENIINHPDLVVFESSNEDVLKIDKIESTDISDDGKVVYTVTVSTVGEGSATLKGRSPVSGRTAQCQISTEEGYVAVAKTIMFNNSSVINYVGELTQLDLDVIPFEAQPVITWTSSDESIATVTESGVLTGHKKGSVRITATTDNGLTATCNVTVNVRGTSISLDKTQVDVVVNKSANVMASILPDDASQSVTWVSADESIATVTNAGTVMGVALGTTTITCTSAEGLTAQATVTVFSATETFELGTDSFTLKKGATRAITAKYTPVGACGRFTWTSSNESVATVSNTGVVKGVGAGTTTISARTADGITKTCSVRVVSPATGLKAKAHNGNTKIAYVKRGQGMYLTPYYTNADCTETFKFFAPKKSKIGSITESGYFTAKRAGTIKITIRSYQDGKKSKQAKFTIKVLKKAKKCKKVKINGKKKIKVGAKTCLTAVTTPKNATVDVTWISKKPTVASIDSFGRVTAIKAGKTKIVVQTTNKKKKVITLTVVK